MPRLEYRASLETMLTPREQLILGFVVAQVNALRTHLQMDALTPDDVWAALRALLRTPSEEGG
jgi:hypothetical protein